ncbi:hypothetical protein FACS1894170_10800 [Planctomycetales bacterium]|nr:hypothetical protein FACS1894170_10800 [Planctomycetales bacterium]
MIYDTLEHLPQYFPQIQELLSLVFDADTPDGTYPLGNGVVAGVQTYQTKPHSETRYESHRNNTDIQIVLSGSEQIDVLPLADVEPAADYNGETDVQFFQSTPAVPPPITCPMVAGRFAAFFPQDAHRPQIKSGGTPQTVRKVVIKLRTSI